MFSVFDDFSFGGWGEQLGQSVSALVTFAHLERSFFDQCMLYLLKLARRMSCHVTCRLPKDWWWRSKTTVESEKKIPQIGGNEFHTGGVFSYKVCSTKMSPLPGELCGVSRGWRGKRIPNIEMPDDINFENSVAGLQMLQNMFPVDHQQQLTLWNVSFFRWMPRHRFLRQDGPRHSRVLRHRRQNRHHQLHTRQSARWRIGRLHRVNEGGECNARAYEVGFFWCVYCVVR